MDIQTAQYYQIDGQNVGIKVTTSNSNEILCVPLSNENSHYQEIMEKVNAGTLTIEDAD